MFATKLKVGSGPVSTFEHTRLVIIYGTFQKFSTSIVLLLGSRLIFGWYEENIYQVLGLI
jgi:hypothetical protein